MTDQPSGFDELFAERLRRKLLPREVVSSVVKASVFVTTFEALKQTVLTAPYALIRVGQDERDYYLGLLEGRNVWTRQYREEVSSRHSDPLRAAASWLVEHEVITQAEADDLVAIRRHRNEVVHEMVKFIIHPDHEVSAPTYASCTAILTKVAQWHTDLVADAEGATPGALMVPNMLAEVFSWFSGDSPQTDEES